MCMCLRRDTDYVQLHVHVHGCLSTCAYVHIKKVSTCTLLHVFVLLSPTLSVLLGINSCLYM